MNWQDIIRRIESAIQNKFELTDVRPIAGGDINSAYQLQSSHQNFFVKLNKASCLSMFEAEAEGLQTLQDTYCLRVPKPLIHGISNGCAFLVLEYLELTRLNSQGEQLFGQQLARLHRQQQGYFGWHRDNTIGSTVQINGHYHSWLEFWREQRLGFQLRLAATNGYDGRLQIQGERLCQNLPFFFIDHQPHPSLLHGDLWAGNAAADERGQPVIFDPACYFGDREADLAMTELFGGFGSAFYQGYQSVYPLTPGYSERKLLYNLYHLLNHLNLFGGGYLSQVHATIDKLLAKID